MKKILASLTFGFFLVGCGQQVDYIWTPTNAKTESEEQCKASCVISDLQVWDITIPAKDTASYIGLIGDTLRTYTYQLEDKSEGIILEKVEFDSLKIGMSLPGCKIEEVLENCP